MPERDMTKADVQAVLPLARSLIAGLLHGKDEWIFHREEINALMERGNAVEVSALITALTLLANLLLHAGVVGDIRPDELPVDLNVRLGAALDFCMAGLVVDDA